MAGKFNTFENDFLNLVFINTVPSTVIGAGGGLLGSANAGSLWISLHTASPTDTGSFAAEVSYTGYARVAVARGSGTWTVSGGVCTNDAAITFGTNTVGTPTATHFGICKNVSGTGASDMIMWGAFSAPLAITVGVTPQIEAGDLSITEE